ncbi:hypothetical protein AB5N10_01760 [Weissella paramesenteroides]|uniref:hypothetical protein n=1 Tax=Weissella paramesenteroides TaxID=1249 RepID=UPI001129AB1D|nr:hypothetical protein [Weissella paramesenteroides]MBU7556917.1 hypothetical protein [Weissella paramesenteroides]TPF01553.1 hypothetical protein DIS13_07120 [Weissella paramesenteroides]
MKEVITFLIISGGLGFFNLYIAQESDLLYFGKYNKEERLAWLSIYTIINFLLIKTGIVIFKALSTIHFGVIVSILISVLTLIIDLIGTLLLPVFINWLIKIIRILLKKESRAYLPPTNSFFEDIDQWQLFTFDFDGKFISSGPILQGTEERQKDLLLEIIPTPLENKENYHEFLTGSVEMAGKGMLEINELTDYTNKIHFVKIKKC